MLDPVTHVFGVDAESWRNTNAPGAALADTLNPQGGANGATPATRRVIGVTPGTYTGDFYLGNRAYVEVRGVGPKRPTLLRDEVSVAKNLEFTLRNLDLQDCGVAWICRYDAPVVTLFEDLFQYGKNPDKSYNGFVNANAAAPFPQTTTFRRVISDGMGDKSNAKHSMYIEGRPGTKLILDQFYGYGSQQSSIVKTTCSHVEIRNSRIFTRSQRDPSITAHTLIDVPAMSSLILADSEIEMWRNPDPKAPNQGLFTPGVFLRNRWPSLGCDLPAYPNVSWDPPESTQHGMGQPGYGWSGGPETYVDLDFWDAVLSDWEQAQHSEFYAPFASWISDTKFRVPADSASIPWLRNDGTRNMRAVAQFATRAIGLRMPALWVERSATYHALNTFEGAIRPPVLDFNPVYDPTTDAQFLRNRTQPHHFPRVIEVAPAGLPSWFRT